MVSNLTGNLQKKTKRRLLALSHYKFRMKLLQMSTKWNNKINLINEYMILLYKLKIYIII